MTVAPGPVVKHLNVIEDICPGQIPGFIDAFSDAFFFQRTEERFGHSIIPAVATPAHARGQVIGPTEALPVVTAVLATMTSPSGLRRQTAIISASSASSRERVGFIDQPTTLRAKRSMTTARYSQPCQVRI